MTVPTFYKFKFTNLISKKSKMRKAVLDFVRLGDTRCGIHSYPYSYCVRICHSAVSSHYTYKGPSPRLQKVTLLLISTQWKSMELRLR